MSRAIRSCYCVIPIRKVSSKNVKRRESFVYLEGTEVIYGYYPVLLALQSRLRTFYSVFVSPSLRDSRILQLVTHAGINSKFVDSQCLSTLCRRVDKERGVHQGICADVGPLPIQRADHFEYGHGGKTNVLLCGIKDPFNVGSIIRTSYFLGVNDVLLSPEFRSSKLSSVVSKASAGVLEIYPPKVVEDIHKYLRDCQESGDRIIGTHQSSPSSLGGDYCRQNKILLLGNEGDGIPDQLKDYCTDFIGIPPGRSLHPDIDSMNVSAASAIIIKEVIEH